MDPSRGGRAVVNSRQISRATFIQHVLTRVEQEIKRLKEKEGSEGGWEVERSNFEKELGYLEDEENRRYLMTGGEVDCVVAERIRVLVEGRRRRGEEVARGIRGRWRALNWVKDQLSGVPAQCVSSPPVQLSPLRRQKSLHNQWSRILQQAEKQSAAQVPQALDTQSARTLAYPYADSRKMVQRLEEIMGGEKGPEFILWLQKQGDRGVSLCKLLSFSEEGQRLSGRILQELSSLGWKQREVMEPAQPSTAHSRESQLIQQLKEAIDTGDRQVVAAFMQRQEVVAVDLCQLLALSSDEGRCLFVKLMEIIEHPGGDDNPQAPVFVWPEVDEQLRSVQRLQMRQRSAQEGPGSNQANQNPVLVPLQSVVPRQTQSLLVPAQAYVYPVEGVPLAATSVVAPYSRPLVANGVPRKRVCGNTINPPTGVGSGLDEEYYLISPPAKRLRRGLLEVRADR